MSDDARTTNPIRAGSLQSTAHRPKKRAEPPAEQAPRHPRYEMRGLLGQGGQGVVYRMHDRELGRDVALKTPWPHRQSEETVAAFLHEVASTAVLEHPHIIPVYDLGRLEDGRPFYTMRLMSGRSLADALSESGHRAEEAGDEWTLVRIAQILHQTCLALAYAHDRGVIHRDVKPSNILLGDSGEVLLVDWGIARSSVPGRRRTATGTVQGTVSYMSPEQVRGEHVDARTDVYSMGVVLYEALTLRHPYEAASEAEMIAAILRDPPAPPLSRTARFVPPELGEIALRALTKDPATRTPSARRLADELRAFVEGVQEHAQKMAVADRMRAAGDEALHLHAETAAQIAALEADVARLEKAHPAWQPIPEKRLLLDARRQLEGLRTQARAQFLEGVNRLTDAIAHVPDHVAARRALATAFWERFVEAEHEQDAPLAQTCRALVERFHDGRFARELKGDGSLRLRVTPSHAELTLHPLIERDLVLVDGPGRALGTGDVELPEIEMGSYVIVAKAKGFEPARYPVAIFRNTDWDGELRLLPEGSLPEGFVYVPGAEAWLGGDPKATNSWPLRRVRVESFAMKRHPVTFGEWCEFLDAMAAEGQDVEDLLPSTDTEGKLCGRAEGATGFGPSAALESAADVARWGVGCASRMPVIGIDLPAIEQYLAWRGESLGCSLRLPTAEEWELAARGVDRRTYPWGWSFDATLAHVRDSMPGTPTMAPLGTFAGDCSVYGVRDLAGLVQERTASPFDPALEHREVRGGYWHGGHATARAAWRGACDDKMRIEFLGFRPVLEVKA